MPKKVLKYEDLDPAYKAAVIAFLNQIVGETFCGDGYHTTSVIKVLTPKGLDHDPELVKCVVEKYNTSYEEMVSEEYDGEKPIVYPYIYFHEPEYEYDANMKPFACKDCSSYFLIHTMMCGVNDKQLFPLGDVK